MLTPEFTMRRMRRLEPRIEAIVADCLDAMERAGPPADLMRHFAWPIPALATCELLGVPRDDRAELARLADQHRDAARGRARQNAAGKALQDYMTQLALQQRKDPGEDLLGMLVREHGDDITDEELAGLGTFLMGAGFDNMASMLGLGILALLEHPDQLAALRRRPELIDSAVDELLRYLTVIPTASPRTAKEDLTIAGREVKAGQRVLCSLLAANRTRGGTDRTARTARTDRTPAGPDRTDADEDRLDITRENVPHVAFGHGVHHCLGAPLARMELRIAYLALLRRFPALRPAVPATEIRFRPSQSRSYGVESLPVAW
jgi:cytochrome P450